MPILIVVDDPARWPLQLSGGEVIAARSYLTESKYFSLRGAKVFNLCRSYRYQSTGYYVSLLATARGHKPQPSVTTIQDFKSPSIIRVAGEELDAMMQKSLAPLISGEFVLSVYFGRNLARRYDRLSRQLFSLFRAPFLQASFVRSAKKGNWQLQSLKPLAGSEIPEGHREFAVEAAQEYFRRGRPLPRRRPPRYDLAILADPAEQEPPSNRRALERFVRAGEALGLAVEVVGREDYGRLPQFDALFIRETTHINHHSYRFARRAAAEGLVVVDDPESILKCGNKVFLAELLERNDLPAPSTLIVHRGNRERLLETLSLPLILKEPDSAFSKGVTKVEREQDLCASVDRLLERSELVIAQEFLPTPFDWRIGIFDRRPLFACRYYMAHRHWQILRRDSRGNKSAEGASDTLPLDQVPKTVLRTALKAANLIGDGLYGVDLKQVGRKVYVIEVNDNPNIDAGVEDLVLKQDLYREVMAGLLERIERRKARGRS